MNKKLPSYYKLNREVSRALDLDLPILALESTVITHGLPYPENRALAQDMEEEALKQGVVPATIAVIEGQIHIGLQPKQLEYLAQGKEFHKISTRDFAPAVAKGWNGGTTVAATLLAAHATGIQVFATGGIGGVHRSVGNPSQGSYDISADLPQLAKTPMVVVCAGAKAILDLPATLEYLETVGVPVVGFATDGFPAFYSRQSGLKTSARADSPEEVAAIACAHWELGQQSAILVVAPPPEEVAMPAAVVEEAIRQALQEAEMQRVSGQAVTPFMLKRVSELTGGASLQANLGLLLNNARIASQIAKALVKDKFLAA